LLNALMGFGALRGELTLLIAEHSADRALSFAPRALVLERGTVAFDGASDGLTLSRRRHLIGVS